MRTDKLPKEYDDAMTLHILVEDFLKCHKEEQLFFLADISLSLRKLVDILNGNTKTNRRERK